MLEPDIGSVHEDLVRAGVLAPVVLGGPEERAWLDCDLASLAESRLGDLLDPRELDASRRAEWLARATRERPMSLARRSFFERCYWLFDDGERVGTLALAAGTLGNRRLHLSSFYVLPPFRGRGVGRRAMESVERALAKQDLGLRLDASWCWQRAVAFYMQLGLWVQLWKRDLVLCWDPETPPPRIEVGEQTASLSVPHGSSWITLVRASRRGDVLEMEEPPIVLADDPNIGDAYWNATSTLSLALALRGWPLVRSPEEWEQSRYADGGPPEALAYKITIWEAWTKHHGWLVQTPRIPGLDYPTWEELQGDDSDPEPELNAPSTD